MDLEFDNISKAIRLQNNIFARKGCCHLFSHLQIMDCVFSHTDILSFQCLLYLVGQFKVVMTFSIQTTISNYLSDS